MPSGDRWSEIIELQQYIKNVSIWIEEYNFDGSEIFIHPMKEQRDALEHICRSKVVELGIVKQEQPQEYIDHNYDKAVGHLYRGFFDTADCTTMLLREWIIKELSPYTNECIVDVLPDYYNVVRPSLEDLTKAVSNYRQQKDISKKCSMQIVKEYYDTIEAVLGYRAKIISALPSLEEHKQKQEKRDCKNSSIQSIIACKGAIVGAVIGGIITAIIALLINKQSQ